ncbi:NACHT, LRR and PYD domains-containing protein 2 [Holothuria leucospilota]|uniref:NACHT, LRR and PYD domains-containing protein 2 n=1 Tax=Holothuria leucospilota TaxID=206669 RepID=A0A9Q1CT63_HOLLE|nr:NACHT, LRR and PYD domains-containing protein 2 [Holothuria leucospilota]
MSPWWAPLNSCCFVPILTPLTTNMASLQVTSTPSRNPLNKGFGKFVIELKESLTSENKIEVATALGFPAALIERIQLDTTAGHAFTQLLQQRGIISPSDIAQLIDALETCKLHGIVQTVTESFNRNVGWQSPSTTSELQDLTEQFLQDIKGTYEDMYSRVQPVSYIRERCVNTLFIDSGIEYFNKEGRSKMGRGTWHKLDSYNSIFTDPRLANSMLYVLVGDPGYGKSTLALQYVYDWCNRCLDSPLKDVEMLIFLRLRYLKGGMPFVKAIKEFLLPSDSALDEDDISGIIQDCKSVVIVFDGFDEYAAQGDTDDVIQIIARKMLRKCKVILTTRPSSTPPRLAHKTEQVRLTGFDSQARERYILKAVVDGNSEAAAKILQRLQQSPVFADICQVALFFVMFAHMTHERDMSVVFESVTSFFRYVVSSFYEHKQIRAGTVSATVKDVHTSENQQLYKFAFESLRGKDRNLVWERETFLKLIGEPLYNELVEIGVLVEENVVEIVDDPGTSAGDHIQRRTHVSFHHKLICEWYAARYVADFVSRTGDGNLTAFFKGIDPVNLQYVYRIGCGLNPAAADKIIRYLHSIEGGDKFAILCILEQTGDMAKIKETIRQICFEKVMISGYDSLLLQRSTMQLLEIAARYENSCFGIQYNQDGGESKMAANDSQQARGPTQLSSISGPLYISYQDHLGPGPYFKDSGRGARS